MVYNLAIPYTNKEAKMLEWLYFIVGVIISISLLFFNYQASFGVMVALLALLALKFLRQAFIKKVMSTDKINVGLFVIYMVIVFLIMAVPLALAFYLPNYINPYFLGATIIIERIYMFVSKQISHNQEEVNV